MSVLEKALEFAAGAIRASLKLEKHRPIVLGINGPQGSGKSFLSKHLGSKLGELYPGLSIALILIDDLYLTYQDQLALNRQAECEFGDNVLLQGRGLPGTHDLGLGIELFSQFSCSPDFLSEAGAKAPAETLSIPVYDKGAWNGKGDRVAQSKWPRVKNPPDLVIFEGWFVGYKPLTLDQLRVRYFTSDPLTSTLQKYKLYHLDQVNDFLRGYQKLWSFVDYFILLETSSCQQVYQWRLQQEHELKKSATNDIGMSDDEVITFVNRYMPMYELYYQDLCELGLIDKPKHNLRLEIDQHRNLLNSQVF